MQFWILAGMAVYLHFHNCYPPLHTSPPLHPTPHHPTVATPHTRLGSHYTRTGIFPPLCLALLHAYGTGTCHPLPRLPRIHTWFCPSTTRPCIPFVTTPWDMVGLLLVEHAGPLHYTTCGLHLVLTAHTHLRSYHSQFFPTQSYLYPTFVQHL